MTQYYPFTAIVGQEKMKRALLLNLINPRIGGVLIMGEKGTAKSTIVRALSQLLPSRAVVELPISSSEDKLVGSIDIEHAIQTGEIKFEPGLLYRAHQNILYIDEVNLLEDHLVDILLDVAAMGVNHIEREGISYSHPSRFVLVGTMNPEEGELRPQLLDRFGLALEVRGEQDINQRMEILKRRLAFEESPEAFCQQYKAEEQALAQKITEAQKHLEEIHYDESILERIAQICIALEVDGHRADLTLLKTAITLAAYKGKTSVDPEDIYESAELALAHRLRRLPFESGSLKGDEIRSFCESFESPKNK